MAFVCEWKNSKFNNSIICAFYYLIRLRKKVFNDIFICAAMCGYASSVWLYQPSPLMASRFLHSDNDKGAIRNQVLIPGYNQFHAIRIQSVSCHPDTICFMPSGYNLFHAIWIHSVSWDPDTFCFMRSGYNLFHAIRIQSVSCHPDTKVIICYSLYLATETGYELYPRLPIYRILYTQIRN